MKRRKLRVTALSVDMPGSLSMVLQYEVPMAAPEMLKRKFRVHLYQLLAGTAWTRYPMSRFRRSHETRHAKRTD
ncbi:MAG: hypothetical protein GY758_11780 [Fuerstiella sp.]|nr:hypothetical protein [Fuerstiella sp.]MDG2130913.1 hypothetical protein [Fuerstiella sp.]